MKILGVSDKIDLPSAVIIGVFDGMHRGHIKLCDNFLDKKELVKIIYTFKRHNEENLLFTQKEEEYILGKTGADYAVFQEFDQKFRNTDRDDFIKILKDKYNCKYIACGEDFRFGKDAMGDALYLKQECGKYGIKVDIVSTGLYEGEKISSTRIRECVKKGDMINAEKMLGYLYFINSDVEKGNMIGRTIDFPTANIASKKLLPSFGVYATYTKIDGKIYRSVSNVGIKPTVQEQKRVNIETNIFGFEKDIYGKNIFVYFVEKIRSEKKYSGLDELKSAIAADKINAMEILENKNIYKGMIL